jgi:hypothetical protein
MPQQGITFDGAYISLPGAYYADNVANAGPNTPPTTPPLLFLGYGWGPKPFTPTTYVNPQNLLAALRGGPAAAYVPFMANPSPAVNGAQLITFMDVSSNTQSQAALLNATGNVQLALTSTLYGPPSNKLTYQVSPPSSGLGGYNLTLTDNFAGTQIVGANLGIPFIMAYSGAATGAVVVTLNVIASGSSPTFSTISPVPSESISVNIGSGGYSTVSLLMEYLNGTGFYFAQPLSSTNGQLPCTLLQSITNEGLQLPSGGVLQYNVVRAIKNDPVFWVNQFASTLASATTTSGSAEGLNNIPVTGTATFFSGATGGPPTNSSYASGLTAALSIPAWTVFCDSNSTAVQALMAQHCETASSAPYGMWRRGFTGSNIGDTVATSVTNAQNLDSLQMAYLYPGIYSTNTTTGQNQLYGGLYAAAAAAAIATGNIVALPLTNKVLNGNGVEDPGGSQLTASQLTTLENGGVMALWQGAQFNGPPTILSDVTTWQVDANVENTSSQQVACRYWLAYSITNVLRQYVGTIASPTTEVTILNAVKRILNALIYTGGSSNGVLASWEPGSLVLTYTGTLQLASITVNVVLVGQNRYITCFATVEPLSFVIVNTSAT